VASLLELPYEKVPNFVEELDWNYAMQKFLKTYNMYPLYLQRTDPLYQKVNYIATGKSFRGDFHHAIIMNGNDMVHDPHPSNLGIENFQHIIVFQPIDPSLM
jgi:hypothetical protein